MRIVHVIHNLKREGAQAVVANLARALDPAHFEPIVHGWRALGPIEEPLRAAGVEVVGPDPARHHSFVIGAVRLRRMISARRIDLIHAHMSDAAILAFCASWGTRVPFVVTHHSNRLTPRAGALAGAARRALLRAAVHAAAANVAVTDAVRMRLQAELGLPGERTACILNGVDVPTEAAAAKARADRGTRRAERGGPRIVAVGRLSEVKRHATLLEAMPLILACLPAARLCIVGDGPLRQELADRAAALDVAAAVEFAGSVDNVGAFLADADLFVSTSSYEGLPMALLEAMSWGLPVIASDVPGNRDVVVHEENGLLFPLDDPHSLAAAVARLAADGSFADTLGERARSGVLAAYGSRTMAAQYESLYERVLEGAGRRRGTQAAT